MVGSVFLIQVESLAAAQAFSGADPYCQAGVFSKIDIHEVRWSIGNGKPA
jgi:uncharacterized protein